MERFNSAKEHALELAKPILASYFDSLRDLSGKGEHSDISKFDTELVVLHTYLVISQVLRYWNKSEK